MTAPKQAEAVMTSIPKFVSSIPEKPVAECNPLNIEIPDDEFVRHIHFVVFT